MFARKKTFFLFSWFSFLESHQVGQDRRISENNQNKYVEADAVCVVQSTVSKQHKTLRAQALIRDINHRPHPFSVHLFLRERSSRDVSPSMLAFICQYLYYKFCHWKIPDKALLEICNPRVLFNCLFFKALLMLVIILLWWHVFNCNHRSVVNIDIWYVSTGTLRLLQLQDRRPFTGNRFDLDRGQQCFPVKPISRIFWCLKSPFKLRLLKTWRLLCELSATSAIWSTSSAAQFTNNPTAAGKPTRRIQAANADIRSIAGTRHGRREYVQLLAN